MRKFYSDIADRYRDVAGLPILAEFLDNLWNKALPWQEDIAEMRELIGSGREVYSDLYVGTFLPERAEIQGQYMDGERFGPKVSISNEDLSNLLDLIDQRFIQFNWSLVGWIHPRDYSTDSLTTLAEEIAGVTNGVAILPLRPGTKRPMWERYRFRNPDSKTWSFEIRQQNEDKSLRLEFSTTLRGICSVTITSVDTTLPSKELAESLLSKVNAQQGNISSRKPSFLRHATFWGAESPHTDRTEYFVSSTNPDLVSCYIVPQVCASLWVSHLFTRATSLYRDCSPDAISAGVNGFWIDTVKARSVLARYVPQHDELETLLVTERFSFPEGFGGFDPVPPHPYFD